LFAVEFTARCRLLSALGLAGRNGTDLTLPELGSADTADVGGDLRRPLRGDGRRSSSLLIQPILQEGLLEVHADRIAVAHSEWRVGWLALCGER
jgi:hypothetical protein